MEQKVARTAGPTLGMAIGYFAVIWGVKAGLINVEDQVEAVAMAGIAGVHIITEIKGLFTWIGGLIKK